MRTADEARAQIAQWKTWYHQIEIAPGIVTPGVNDSARVLARLDGLGLPTDCRGLRALDVGTRDGYFAFELERRGAEVLAIDYMPEDRTGFPIARKLLGSKVRYEVTNVYDVTKDRLGRFELVLFLGVLYHLRNPLLAIDRLRDVSAGRLWFETQVIDDAFLEPASGQFRSLRSIAPAVADVPLMQFYPGRSLNNDPTNWWAPNIACLRAMFEDADFAVQDVVQNGARALGVCTPADRAETKRLNQAERTVVR